MSRWGFAIALWVSLLLSPPVAQAEPLRMGSPMGASWGTAYGFPPQKA